MQRKLARYGEVDLGSMAPTLQGKVLVWDPKCLFVVLDAGENQGILKSAELLVSRDGKLVGKVKVDRVEKNRAIASVMPGWQFAEIIEGDLLVPAHPERSL